MTEDERVAAERFARCVQSVYRATRPSAYAQGVQAGEERIRDMVEQTALRAALSNSPQSDEIEKVLRCILAKSARDTCDDS